MNDLTFPTGCSQGRFRHLACAMQTNSVRQHEFATLLRRLSSRFASGTTERRMLRLAANTARCKENKLKKLLVNLGWKARIKRTRTLRFLTCFKLATSVPVPVTILLLTLIIAKPVRARLLDPFYPWKPTQPMKGRAHFSPHPN